MSDLKCTVLTGQAHWWAYGQWDFGTVQMGLGLELWATSDAEADVVQLPLLRRAIAQQCQELQRLCLAISMQP